MRKFSTFKEGTQRIVIKKPWGVEIKDYKAGDPIPAGVKFKIFDAKDTDKIDAYADSLDESADYQKKRFKEPSYMYESFEVTDCGNGKSYYKAETQQEAEDWAKENVNVLHRPLKVISGFKMYKKFEPRTIVKESVEKKSDYLKIIDRFRKDINKEIDKIENIVEKGKLVEGNDRSEATVLATRFDAEMLRYNLAIQNKVLTEGYRVIFPTGASQKLKTIEDVNKFVNGVLHMKDKNAPDVHLTDATLEKWSKENDIPLVIIKESKKITESEESKSEYLKYLDQFDKDINKYIDSMRKDIKAGKAILLPEVYESISTAIVGALNRYNNAVKTKTLTESVVIKESLSSKTHKFKPEELKVGKRVIDKVAGKEVHGKITVNHHDLYKDNPYTQDKKGSTVVTIVTDSGKSYDVDANDNGGEFILESRIARGYENLDAEERAKHLLSHPTSKYMSDLKSENITERAIRKAVKEMLGKPDKRDPQFITDVNEDCIKESAFYVKFSQDGKSSKYYVYNNGKHGFTDDKSKATKFSTKEEAENSFKKNPYYDAFNMKYFDIVSEEGEAPAVATSTANVANPDLPLKLKESYKLVDPSGSSRTFSTIVDLEKYIDDEEGLLEFPIKNDSDIEKWNNWQKRDMGRDAMKIVKESGNSWVMGNGDKIEAKPDVIIRTTKDGEKFMMPRKEWEKGEYLNPIPNWRKMKEDLESDKAEALADYKKAKAEYLANKSDENWKKFSDAKAKCMQLGCRI